MKTLSVLTKGRLGDVDRTVETDITPHGALAFNFQGNARVRSPFGFFTTFPLLPATTQAAANEKMLVSGGTGTEVVARSAKGGITLTTGGSDNDSVVVAGVATTDSVMPITAVSQIRFATRINLAAITSLQCGAGLDETNGTNASCIGSANAGEGAQFLFDPTDELSLVAGGTVAANWVLAMKVDGTDTYKDSGVKVVAGKDYELMIQIGADLKPNYYIDGVLVGTGASALTSGDSFGAVVGIQAATAAAKAFDVRYVAMERFMG